MCQKKGLLLITGNIFNAVKNNVYKSLFVLFGLFRDIIKMAVFFIKKNFNSFFYVFFGNRICGLRFYVNRQNSSKPVYQPGLSGCFIKYFFYRFFSKGLVCLYCILSIKITDIFQGKWGKFDLVCDIKWRDTAYNQLGNVANAYQTNRVKSLVCTLLVFLI